MIKYSLSNSQGAIMLDDPQEPINWNFTAETNAEGRTYIKAYKMGWDKVAKKPRRILRRHVGRLMSDDRIAISPKFLEDHPQYRGQDWYWGTQHKPVTLAEYRRQFPESPGKNVDPEDEELLPTLSVGLTWAAWQLAGRHGILDNLLEVFDEQTARTLLHLAIYKLAGGSAMGSYDLWRQQVWLPENIRLSGQKISQVLSNINRDKVVDYFKRRHERRLEIRSKEIEKSPELRGHKIEYALDSTSISSYSETNGMAQYGHAKRDPELRQINQTFVCDQRSGDVLFVHMYDGAVNDVSSLFDVLMNMQGAGFDLSDNILVTDRGYSSLINVQRMINMELAFVQGVRRSENAIDEMFARKKTQLQNGAFYNGNLKASAFTYEEPWQQDTDAGRLSTKVYVHLYRLDERYEQQRELIWKNADEIITLKSNGRRVPQDQWDAYGRFVKEHADKGGKSVWTIDTKRMDEVSEKATQFVLRSNCISDPFRALEIYRHRGVVEQDFNALKNWLDGDRLRVGAKGMYGKVFVQTLATSLRMLMLFTAKQTVAAKPTWRIPNDSLDCLLKMMDLVKADRRKNANAWVRNTIPAKRRRCFELLELPEPPRVLRVGSI